MAYARVFVNHHPDPPAHIDAQVRCILGIPSWDERVGGTLPDELRDLAQNYCKSCRGFAEDQAGESDWRTELLLNVIRPIARVECWAASLKHSGAEKPWNSSLKPSRPRSDFPQVLPDTLPLSSAATTLLGMTSTASDTSLDDPNGLFTPKPDVTIGLANGAFGVQHQDLLVHLQHAVTSPAMTDPHQAQIGLHFPFLVAEVKDNLVNGNLSAAQNQAAVDGACMLNILYTIETEGSGPSPTIDIADAEADANVKETENDAGSPHICFSVTTEGPQHELWVHFCDDSGAYHMTFLRSWQTTTLREADEFVHALIRIVEWGVCCFKDSVAQSLHRIGDRYSIV